MVRCMPGWVKIWCWRSFGGAIIPLLGYARTQACTSAPCQDPLGTWAPPHLRVYCTFSLQRTPLSYLWRICRPFRLVSSPLLIFVLCAFIVAVPAEDCFAILGRPLFAALLSSAAINFVAAGVVTLLRTPSLPCHSGVVFGE